MYTKTYTKDDGNTTVTATYASWHEMMFEQAYVGFVYFIVGLIALIGLPFSAVYYIFRPRLLSYGEHHEELFYKKKDPQ